VLFPAPVPVSLQVQDAALAIAAKYRYSIYDSLIIAAALEARCSILYSEDRKDGQVVGGLTIATRFRVRCLERQVECSQPCTVV
jgi:predicted nucleic acid-binding protein